MSVSLLRQYPRRTERTLAQWNSAWPIGDSDINADPDNAYVSNLGGRTYMAGVSPWFFTVSLPFPLLPPFLYSHMLTLIPMQHYGPDTYAKNFIYRADDWLPSERFELLIHNRHSVALTQLITWNDYGESHYVGPIHGAQPDSQKWVDGFDHTGAYLQLVRLWVRGSILVGGRLVGHDRILYPGV